LNSLYPIVIVARNLQQAARGSDFTAFFFQGRSIEFGPTSQIFTNPTQKKPGNLALAVSAKNPAGPPFFGADRVDWNGAPLLKS
jgi:ABC-type dipeptide/oligopeptide/nickel transport system ATPase component